MLVHKKRILRQKDRSSIMKTVVLGNLCVSPHSELLCISRGGTKLQAIVPKKKLQTIAKSSYYGPKLFSNVATALGSA
jgi:hypothetical protein